MVIDLDNDEQAAGKKASVVTIESLQKQMEMMQQMQDWLVEQKETEMGRLREKVDGLHNDLIKKEVDIALMQKQLNQQEDRLKRHLNDEGLTDSNQKTHHSRVDTGNNDKNAAGSRVIDLDKDQKPNDSVPTIQDAVSSTLTGEDEYVFVEGDKQQSKDGSSEDHTDKEEDRDTFNEEPPLGKGGPKLQGEVFFEVDDKSVGQSIHSETYGDEREKVFNSIVTDPYGDRGHYTGIVYRSSHMPHGLGFMLYEADQRTYEGDWRHGRWHGHGKASFANGDAYEGSYRFDQRHGRGIYKWNDGRIYDGNFNEDKRDGKGIFKWPDGAIYEGDFVQGQRDGHGRYTFADGGYYVGNWVNGRYEGFGECHWEDGRQYVGEWKAGMAHGNGIEKYSDGRVRHDGQWVNDEPIRVNQGLR